MAPLQRSTFVTPAVLLVALLSALLLTFAPSAQAATTGSGRVVTESRAVAGYDAIAVAGSLDVVVRQGGREAVEVSADDNVLPLVETVVEARRLVVRMRPGTSLRSHSPIRVAVDVLQLSALSLSGSGDAIVGPLKAATFELAISGSGDARIERIEADSLGVAVSGSGDVRAAGRAGALRVRIAGSGDVDLREVVAAEASVSIAGSGDAAIHATRSAEVRIAGSGDVTVHGQPPVLKSSVAGSGHVIRR